jgi:D-xylulose reductase
VREIAFRGIFRYCNTYKQALKMVAAGQINLKPFKTRTFRLTESVKAFETVRDGLDNAIKVQIIADDQ